MLAVHRLAEPFLCRCGREPGNGTLAVSDPSPNVVSKVASERRHMDPAIAWRHLGHDKNEHLLQRGLSREHAAGTRWRVTQRRQASGAARAGTCRTLRKGRHLLVALPAAVPQATTVLQANS